MENKEDLIAWLNDAYAMEKDSEQILEHRVEDVKRDHPEMTETIQSHLEETREQANRLKTRIEALGGTISAFKTGLYNLMGMVKGRSTGMFKDEMVKNSIADYTQESMEIASYKALLAGAKEMGDEETAQVVEQNLKEEEKMAKWLDQHMPSMVKHYLSQA